MNAEVTSIPTGWARLEAGMPRPDVYEFRDGQGQWHRGCLPGAPVTFFDFIIVPATAAARRAALTQTPGLSRLSARTT